MIEGEWKVGQDRDELPAEDEEYGEGSMDDVLWQDQLVQIAALLDRVLVVGSEFIDADHLKGNAFRNVHSLVNKRTSRDLSFNLKMLNFDFQHH